MEILSENLKNDISTILREAQESLASHQKCKLILYNIFDKTPEELFLNVFKKSIAQTLAHGTDSTFVDRLLEFFATFTTSLQPQKNENNCDNSTFQHILEFLILVTKNKNKYARLRSFILIKQIVRLIQENRKFLSDSLTECIVEACLNNVEQEAKIRKEIITCLHYFQDVEEPDVHSHIVKSIMSSNIQARQTAIQVVEISPESLLALISAIRDVNEHVRLKAYTKLSETVRFLKINQRREIILSSLWEESPVVLNNIPTFLNNWLKCYDGNIIQLMQGLRFDGNEKDVEETKMIFETVLNNLFKTDDLKEFHQKLPVNENQLVPFDNLNWETSSYWRILFEYIHNNHKEIDIENFLPDFITFCSYIKQYCTEVFCENSTDESTDLSPTKYLEIQFILTQLFQITKIYDVHDVARAHKLNELVTYVLENGFFGFDCCQAIVDNLKLTIPNNNDRATFIVNIANSIKYPEKVYDDFNENSAKLAELNVQLKRLEWEKNEAAQMEDYTKADNLLSKINEIKEEIQDCETTINKVEDEFDDNKLELSRVLKYLKIVNAFFNSTQIDKLTPAMETIKSNFIVSELNHENEIAKKFAYRAYGKCCVISKNDAKNGIHLFAIPINSFYLGNECSSDILEVCIKIVTDLLVMYGTTLVAEPADASNDSVDEENVRGLVGGTSLTELLQAFTQIMDIEEDDNLRQVATRAVCLLVLYERINSPSIMSRLIIKWSNPISKLDGLQAIIGSYLKSYTAKCLLHENIKESVMITVEKIFNAPDTSPLFDVNLQDVAKFMLALCKECNEDYHSELMFKICNYILNKPRKKINSFYSKMLLWMDLKDGYIDDIRKLCKEVKTKPISPEVAKNFIKFEKVLMKKSGKEGNSETESDEDKNSV